MWDNQLVNIFEPERNCLMVIVMKFARNVTDCNILVYDQMVQK